MVPWIFRIHKGPNSNPVNIHVDQLKPMEGADHPDDWTLVEDSTSGPEVIKLFPCSTQLSTKFILLINVIMPTIVGILTFICMMNTTSERLIARNFICRYFSYNKQLKFRAQLP